MCGRTLVYVIYDHPRDFPDHYVLRPMRTNAGRVEGYNFCCVADSIEELRGPLIAVGAVNVGRDPLDDPVILEIWI